jgi:hypothetical protein
MATIPPALEIQRNVMMSRGCVALLRRGKPVWIGKLTDPWEDVDFDLMIVSPEDFEQIARRIADQI